MYKRTDSKFKTKSTNYILGRKIKSTVTFMKIIYHVLTNPDINIDMVYSILCSKITNMPSVNRIKYKMNSTYPVIPLLISADCFSS